MSTAKVIPVPLDPKEATKAINEELVKLGESVIEEIVALSPESIMIRYVAAETDPEDGITPSEANA